MSRFGGRQGGFHGFPVAHFADQDNIRILPERVFHGGGKRIEMTLPLTLRQKGLFTRHDVFDRILKRNNMACFMTVQIGQHAPKRRCFAAARRAYGEHQPCLQPAQAGKKFHIFVRRKLLERI